MAATRTADAAIVADSIMFAATMIADAAITMAAATIADVIVDVIWTGRIAAAAQVSSLQDRCRLLRHLDLRGRLMKIAGVDGGRDSTRHAAQCWSKQGV